MYFEDLIMSNSFLSESPRNLPIEENSESDDFLHNYNKLLAISSDFNFDFQYYPAKTRTFALQK